jgi:hypothetical protein
MIDSFLDLVVLLSEMHIVIVKIVIVEVKFVYFLVVEYSLLLHLLPFFFNVLGLLARNCLCWSILQAGYLLFQILDCSAVSLNVVVGHSDLVDFLYDLSLQWLKRTGFWGYFSLKGRYFGDDFLLEGIICGDYLGLERGNSFFKSSILLD